MNGSVRKRGSSWSYYFSYLSGGKRKKKEKGGFRTKREAEAALAAAVSAYNHEGAVFSPSNLMLDEYLDEWLEIYRPEVRPGTFATAKSYINAVRPYFAGRKLRSISPADCQRFLNHLVEQGYTQDTIGNISIKLHSALDYAVEPLGYIQSNPMDKTRPVKSHMKKKARIALNFEQYAAIEEQAKGTPYYLPIAISFHTGMRLSEVLGLTWDNIDLDSRTITVRRQRIGNDLTDTKTASSVRTVPIGATLTAILRDAYRQQRIDELSHGSEYRLHVLSGHRIEQIRKGDTFTGERLNLVCVAPDGSAVTKRQLAYACKGLQSVVPGFTFHVLRHTHATMLIEAGVSPKSVQARLGHASITTTLQTYVHDTDGMAATAVEQFEQALNG